MLCGDIAWIEPVIPKPMILWKLFLNQSHLFEWKKLGWRQQNWSCNLQHHLQISFHLDYCNILRTFKAFEGNVLQTFIALLGNIYPENTAGSLQIFDWDTERVELCQFTNIIDEASCQEPGWSLICWPRTPDCDELLILFFESIYCLWEEAAGSCLHVENSHVDRPIIKEYSCEY